MDDASSDSSLIQSHPNRLSFSGTLVRLGRPSDSPPHGSDGHLIMVPKPVAARALQSLVGMAVNYQTDLEGHNPRHKVGVITSAWIDGDAVKVKGVIWKKDFPEAEKLIHRHQGMLGMSMELGDVYVADADADVWRLEKFHFTGASILFKDSAAYESTSLAAAGSSIRSAALAAAASALGVLEDKTKMAEKEKKDNAKILTESIADATGPAVKAGIAAAMDGVVAAINKGFDKLGETIKSGNKDLKACITDAGVTAAEKKPNDASEPSSSDADATDATSTMDSARKSDSTADDEPSANDATATDVDASSDAIPPNRDLNPDASSARRRWSDDGATTEITDVGKRTSTAIASAKERVKTMNAQAIRIKALEAALYKEKERNSRTNKKVDEMSAQIEKFTEFQGRKSVAPELAFLIEKTNPGTTIADMRGNGTKFSPAQVDKMFAECGIDLPVVQRMAFKNQLLQAGLMDQGLITPSN
jgi:hypothetical protein